ncbi:MAG: hypothetical protein M3010_10995 [Candidatus Dormibacteraeota bacterium]|nr:hypothetical protein [Candidatus Dormibacteraeota bacterium]
MVDNSSWPADLSPDGRYTWDGTAWQPNAISPDGVYYLYRNAWHPLPPAAPRAPEVPEPSSQAGAVDEGTLSTRPLTQLIGAPLAWRRTKQNHAILVSGSELFGTMHGWEGTSLVTGKGRVEAVAADGRWIFGQPSVLMEGKVAVTEDPSGRVLAEFFSSNFRKIDITLPSGWRVGFQAKNYFTHTWHWLGPRKEELIFLDREAMTSWRSLVQERPVKISPEAAAIPELSLLVFLGEYLARLGELRR